MNNTAWILKLSFPFVIYVSMLNVVAFAQDPQRMQEAATFHIYGTIYGPRKAVAPHVDVKVVGAGVSKVVITDDNGQYAVDLPTGFYSMTAAVPTPGSVKFNPFLNYFRPVFFVNSTGTVTLNGTLYFARPTCDVAVVTKSGESPTQEQLEEATKNLCGGEDFFSEPSTEGIPFQIYVRYPKRQVTAQGNLYVSDKIYETEAPVPVFVAYNLFSLEANEVRFNVQDRTLTATGSVVIADGSSKTQTLDSISLKFENGRTTLLH